MHTVTLPNGTEMPMIGLGTWTLRGAEGERAVEKALDLGYRHIDTAEGYNNQPAIGRALAASPVPREELFITSKVSRENLRYDDVLAACDETLAELGTDYLDLYLIHWPNRHIPMRETFRALTELHQQGKVREIGVSNFTIAHVREARDVSETAIAVNQVEYHPYLNQTELLEYCQQQGVALEAYSPLARGEVFQDPQLKDLAEKQGRSVSQIVLKWMFDKGIVLIPRSTSRRHLQANLDLFDWELDPAVREGIEGIEKERRLIDPPTSEFDRVE